MNYKEISEIIPLNAYDTNEKWDSLNDDHEQSETGRIAKKVLDLPRNQIGRIHLEAVESVLVFIAEKVVEAFRDGADAVDWKG